MFAFVHLFPGVNSPVLFVNIGAHELLSTVLALEGFVTTMDDPVLTKVRTESETLTTF